MPIRLDDLLAPREPGKPLYLALDHLRSLVQADIVLARVVDDGREFTVFGRYRKSRMQLGEGPRRHTTLVVEVSSHEVNDLLTVVSAVKGEDDYPDEPPDST